MRIRALQNLSGKSVEEEIFRHFVLQHFTDTVSLRKPHSLNDVQLPRIMQEFVLEFDHNNNTNVTSEENALLSRMKAENYFKGKPLQHSYPLNRNEEEVCDPFERQMEVEKENIQEKTWPVEMLHPSKTNYKVTAQFYSELQRYFTNLYKQQDANNVLHVEPRANIFARCTVNGSRFSSLFNRTDRGHTAMAYWVDETDEGEAQVSPYFGNIQFFMTVNVHQGTSSSVKRVKHRLAYIQWHRFANRNHCIDNVQIR